jgi:hypothetical protein
VTSHAAGCTRPPQQQLAPNLAMDGGARPATRRVSTAIWRRSIVPIHSKYGMSLEVLLGKRSNLDCRAAGCRGRLYPILVVGEQLSPTVQNALGGMLLL